MDIGLLRDKQSLQKKKQRTPHSILFVDFKGAFDSPDRRQIIQLATKLHDILNEEYLTALIHLLSLYRIQISDDHQDRTIFPGKGTPQGGKLSPLCLT